MEYLLAEGRPRDHRTHPNPHLAFTSSDSLELLKRKTLRIILLSIIFTSLATLFFFIFTPRITYSYYIQIAIVLFYLSIFAYMHFHPHCDIYRLENIVYFSYAFLVFTPMWWVMSFQRFMTPVIALFILMMTIWLFNGRKKNVLLIIMPLYMLSMYTFDVLNLMDEGLGEGLSLLDQGVGTFTTFFIIVYVTVALKRMYLDANSRLYAMSITDPLTGAFNARRMNELIQHYTDEYLTLGHVYALVMIDMDNFKVFNDQFGHDYGDELLIRCAKTLREGIRKHDLLVRYGGDEFVVILPECTVDEAAQVIHRTLIMINQMGQTHNIPHISFSAGVCDIQEAHDLHTHIFKLADQRSFIAKKQGRNHVCKGDDSTPGN